MSADDRQPGFYFVRHRSRWWTVGQWTVEDDASYWTVIGSDEGFSDDDMSEIGPRIEGEPEPI